MTITDETVIEIKDSPPHFPTPVSLATAWRYALKGVNGVRLETVKLGRKRLTSVEAIKRFVAELTEADEARRAQANSNDPPDERPPELQRRLQQKGIAPKAGGDDDPPAERSPETLRRLRKAGMAPTALRGVRGQNTK